MPQRPFRGIANLPTKAHGLCALAHIGGNIGVHILLQRTKIHAKATQTALSNQPDSLTPTRLSITPAIPC